MSCRNETKWNNLRMNETKIDAMLNTSQDSRAEWINDLDELYLMNPLIQSRNTPFKAIFIGGQILSN
jgi:hypothetical protein